MISKKQVMVLFILCISNSYATRNYDNHPIAPRTSALKKNGTSSLDSMLIKNFLDLLNAGKEAVGLKTENPQELMAMLSSKNKTSDNKGRKDFEGILNHYSVEDMMKESSNLQSEPDEEKVLVLSSGKNGLQVKQKEDKKINMTESNSNDTEIQDVFEMVVENVIPAEEGKSGMIERIEIIEREQWIPVDLSNLDLNQTVDAINHSFKERGLQNTSKKTRSKRYAANEDTPLTNFHLDSEHDVPVMQSEAPRKPTAADVGKSSTLTLVLFSIAMILLMIILITGLVYFCVISVTETLPKVKINKLLKEGIRKNGKSFPVKSNGMRAKISETQVFVQDGDEDDFMEVDLEWEDEFSSCN